jgi:hypothetical protein
VPESLNTVATKVCKVCGVEATKGLYCHPHYNERRRAAYAVMDPEVKARRQAGVRAYHKLHGREAYRRYYYKHHEKVLAKSRIANRKWRAANKDKMLAAVRSWNERNPEKVAEYIQRKKDKAAAARAANRAAD